MSNNFSLALGGGWARWLAHIGVIRRLEELDMTPIAISGTSMGAIVATLYSLGHDSHSLESIIAGVNFLSLIDIDMKRGILKGRKIEKLLDTLFEWRMFADTHIPLTVMATDFDTGEIVAIHEGKLSEAVRASLSIPGVFEPCKHGERSLVDGWLANNLPIETLPPGPVIAISALRDISKRMRYSREILGTVFQKTILGNIYHIVQKTFDIILSQNESRSVLSRRDVIYIRPEFEANLDYLDFRKYEKFIAAGYSKATEILG